MRVQPYLFFEGRCEEAIEFYRKVFGAEVKDADALQGQSRTAAARHGAARQREQGDALKLYHRRNNVMASDGRCSGKTDFKGVSLTVPVNSDSEAERLFAALSNGGQVQMPLTKTFFSSRFGMVADRFGVSWMIIVMA